MWTQEMLGKCFQFIIMYDCGVPTIEGRHLKVLDTTLGMTVTVYEISLMHLY